MRKVRRPKVHSSEVLRVAILAMTRHQQPLTSIVCFESTNKAMATDESTYTNLHDLLTSWSCSSKDSESSLLLQDIQARHG